MDLLERAGLLLGLSVGILKSHFAVEYGSFPQHAQESYLVGWGTQVMATSRMRMRKERRRWGKEIFKRLTSAQINITADPIFSKGLCLYRQI